MTQTINRFVFLHLPARLFCLHDVTCSICGWCAVHVWGVAWRGCL